MIRSKWFSILLVGVVLAVPAWAHDTWLLPTSRFVSPGATVDLDLTSGMAFPQLETAIKPDRVAKSGYRLGGQTSTLQKQAGSKSLRLRAPLAKEGVATLWVGLAPKSIELKPDQVKEYLDEIGAPAAVRQAWQEQTPKRWRELYTKHAKTFVRVGRPAADLSWGEPAGMALEIVPEKDPTQLSAGMELPVRVLRNGAPLPGFAVGLVRQGESQGTLRTTDAQGRIAFKVDRPGLWLLRATDLRKSARQDTDWESDFATMTFEVR